MDPIGWQALPSPKPMLKGIWESCNYCKTGKVIIPLNKGINQLRLLKAASEAARGSFFSSLLWTAFQLDPLLDLGLFYLQVAGVHLGSLAHLEEIFQIGFVYDDVDGHLPLESRLQQVFEYVDVRERVHDHRNNLPEGREEASVMGTKRISPSGLAWAGWEFWEWGSQHFWRCLIYTKQGSKS